MDRLGWDRSTPDDYDDDLSLAPLNLYVLLDALRQEREVLQRRVLAHWKTFQRHQAARAYCPLQKELKSFQTSDI